MTICDIGNCVELYIQVQDNHYTISKEKNWGKSYVREGVGGDVKRVSHNETDKYVCNLRFYHCAICIARVPHLADERNYLFDHNYIIRENRFKGQLVITLIEIYVFILYALVETVFLIIFGITGATNFIQ